MNESHIVMGEEKDKGFSRKTLHVGHQNLALAEKHKADRTQK